MKEVLNKPIAKSFDTDDADDKIDGKILSENAFMASITAFIQIETGKAVVEDRIATR